MKHFRKAPFSKNISFVGFFIILGIVTLLINWAAAAVMLSFEAESGVLAGSNIISDPNASGGSAILFSGSDPTAYPNPYTDFDIPTHSNYVIPTTNIKFVAPAPAGNDANPGTLEQPYATISKGVQVVSAGGTVVVRGGRYYEAIDGSTTAGTQAISKNVIIQAYQQEKPWVDGTDQIASASSDWQIEQVPSQPDRWHVGWTRPGICTVRASCIPFRLVNNVRYYLDGRNTDVNDVPVDTTLDADTDPDVGSPTAGLFDMVFINGVALKQVATKSEVVAMSVGKAGTFYIDQANNQLYIGDDPAGLSLRASTRSTAVTLASQAAGSRILGIGFFGFASDAMHASGAVVVQSPNTLIKDNAVVWSASNGLVVSNPNPTESLTSATDITNTTIAYSGHVGGRYLRAHYSTIDGGQYAYNVHEDFTRNSPIVSAAAIKIGTSHRITVKNLEIFNNNGNGLWCDVQCEDVVFMRNNIGDNDGSGIFFEVSRGAIIANNNLMNNLNPDKADVEGNIKVSSSREAHVYNNTTKGGGIGLMIYFDGRSTDDSGNPLDPMKQIFVRNNIFADSVDTNQKTIVSYRSQDTNTACTLGTATFEVTRNNNAYHRTVANEPVNIYSIRNKPACQTQNQTFTTVASLAEPGSAASVDGQDIFNAGQILTIKSAFSATFSMGSPLPARATIANSRGYFVDIPAAVGVGAGEPIKMGIIR